MTTPSPYSAEAGDPDGGLSWEAGPEGRGLRGVIRTTGALLFDAGGSLHATRLSGELWNAYAYYLGMMMASAAASQVIGRMLFRAAVGDVDSIVRGLESTLPPETVEALGRVVRLLAEPGSASFLFSLTLSFLFWTFYVFAAAALAHACLLLVGAGGGGFEATFKALAYPHGATAPLMVIPFCGDLIMLVWLTGILVVALVEWHRTSTVRVVLALTLPTIPLVCCLGAAMAMLMSRLGGGYPPY